MGSQLRWLERTPDKREVDGSIPFEPTKQKSESRNWRSEKSGIRHLKLDLCNSTLKNIQIDEKQVNQRTEGRRSEDRKSERLKTRVRTIKPKESVRKNYSKITEKAKAFEK